MSQSGPGPSRRRRQYAAQACNSCKRRHHRCDGEQPTCGACISSGHECTWTPDDHWRPATRQYVESLRVKIQLLESKIKQLKELDPRARVPSTSTSPSGGSTPFSLRDGSSHTDPFESLPCVNTPPGIGVTYALSQPPPTSSQTGPTSFRSSGLGIHTYAQPPRVIHSPLIATTPPPPPRMMYKYIFAIDTSIPNEEQTPEVQASLACEWDRYLPNLGTTHLSRLEHDTILSRCFSYGTSWLSGLIPELFLSDMVHYLSPETANSTQTLHYTPMLHCSLLAFAVAFSEDSDIRAHTTRNMFATHAKLWLDHAFHRPNPTHILSLALLSEYHCGMGERATGYMFMGMSLRAAQASQRSFDSAVRDWYHWSTFVQEKLMALDGHRPSDALVPGATISLPIPAQFGGQPPSTSSVVVLFEDKDHSGYVVECFIQSCRLMIIASRVIDDVNKHRSSSLAIDVHQQLEGWFDALPDSLLIRQRSVLTLPHVLSLHICYWWLILDLFLPLLVHAPPMESETDPSARVCSRATDNLIQLLVTFQRQHGLRFFPRNMLRAIHTCGYALLVEQTTSKESTTAREGAGTCLSALREVADTWPCAAGLVEDLEARLAQQIDCEAP